MIINAFLVYVLRGSYWINCSKLYLNCKPFIFLLYYKERNKNKIINFVINYIFLTLLGFFAVAKNPSKRKAYFYGE